MTITDARSLLFVPGSRPDRFAKARDSGADAIVLDLEDAVGPDDKTEARQNVTQWLAEGGSGIVRVNAADTPWHDDDLDAVASVAPGTTVMLPKADPAAAALVAHRTAIVALIETAHGVLEAATIARTRGVVRLAFGNVDLGAELGVDPCDQLALLAARSALVLASAAAGIATPIDGVTTDVRDERIVRADATASRALGFSGKLCIHPAQVAVVHRALAPSAAEIESAERVLAAEGAAVTTLDGRMLDRPVFEHARRVLRRAGR